MYRWIAFLYRRTAGRRERCKPRPVSFVVLRRKHPPAIDSPGDKRTRQRMGGLMVLRTDEGSVQVGPSVRGRPLPEPGYAGKTKRGKQRQ